MEKTKQGSIWTRRIVGAFLTWIIPFVVAVPFYDQNGKLMVDIFLFKSVMIVVASLSSAFLLRWLFRAVKGNYIQSAVVTGIVWLLVNWVLDAIVLVHLLRMPLNEYVTRIGTGYLMIPITAILVGVVVEDALKASNKKSE